MSLAPSPSSSRGEVVLQPAYFTSSVFVHVARADVDRLIQAFSQQYTRCARSRNCPFTLFKDIWQKQGWTWIQFKVFDARSRATFLRVVMRLFLERIGDGETPLSRAAALFGLYVVFRSQPSASAPPLYSAAQVEVTYDVYEELLALPGALEGEFLHPIRPHVVYVQSSLVEAQAFQILPHAATCPQSPRALPREVVGTDAEDTAATTRKGRPSRCARSRRARESLVGLERLCGGAGGDVLDATRSRCAVARAALLGRGGNGGCVCEMG